MDVCLSWLSRIYSLPNIEIHDAFVKLREQVKCYRRLAAQSSSSGAAANFYRTALDIINSTNLDFFGPQVRTIIVLNVALDYLLPPPYIPIQPTGTHTRPTTNDSKRPSSST